MSQEYQQHPFPPTFQSERSWSMLANDFDDEKLHYYPSQASDRSWSMLGSQDINDRGLSTYVPASFPEPEFVPSINASTKNFLYETFKLERKNDNAITGRPNEYVDDVDCSDCPPPPSDIDQSALNSQINISQSQTKSKSWGFGYLSILMVIIAVFLYFYYGIPFPEIEKIH
ncbi:17026_t:CDS:2 [Gigaspora rosea]|nr:17026_t:CDS:2 [Gigaspora rosea]